MGLTSIPTFATGDTIEASWANTLRDNTLLLDARTGGDPGTANKALISSGLLSAAWTQVPTAAIADGAVTTVKIPDANVTAQKLSSGAAITNIGTGAISTGKYGPLSIDTAAVGNGQITNPKMANNAIAAANIIDGNVTTSKFQPLGIDTAAIGNGQVTAPKISSVSGSAIQAGSIPTGAYGALSIDTAAIGNGQVSAGKLASGVGAVPAGLIAAFATDAARIAAGWNRYTALNGRMPVGAGTTFGVTFTEANNYGASWAHIHASCSYGVAVGGTANGGSGDHTSGPTGTGTAGGTGTTLADGGHYHTMAGVSMLVSATGSATGDSSSASWVIPSWAVVWSQMP
jgi:hypothetical protein